ncbi:hypothetical protein CUN59_02400, partial [Cuspidothrix issatschenkoi CHARLIE-1]
SSKSHDNKRVRICLQTVIYESRITGNNNLGTLNWERLNWELLTGNREQGTLNWELLTGNRELLTGNREQGTGNRERGTGEKIFKLIESSVLLVDGKQQVKFVLNVDTNGVNLI